jgi:hypothetical protein
MQSTKQERMFALIEQKSPSQDVASFCKEHSIGAATYYYWLKKYREQQVEEQGLPFACIEVSGATGPVVATVQLRGGSLITLYHPEAFAYIQPLL